MSAYMIDREHVDYLIAAALHYGRRGGAFRWYWEAPNGEGLVSGELPTGDKARASEVGRMLWRENLRSIHARYPDTIDNPENIPGPCDEDFGAYTYTHPGRLLSIDPVQVLASVKCYAYQACEHEGWKASEAKTFADALKDAAINALPGYDEAAWGAPRCCYRDAAA